MMDFDRVARRLRRHRLRRHQLRRHRHCSRRHRHYHRRLVIVIVVFVVVDFAHKSQFFHHGCSSPRVAAAALRSSSP